MLDSKPRSVAPLLATPRTEVEVAAQVICRLFTEHILNANATTIAEVARATGVPVDAIRYAWRQSDVRPYRPPTTEVPIKPSEARQEKATKASHANPQYRKANPEPGKKVCARCGETFPIAKFPVKDKKKGTRRSYCEPCWKTKCRERYLSVTKAELLNELSLEFVLGEADEVVGLACTGCGLALKVGDRVAGTAALHHLDCEPRVSPSTEETPWVPGQGSRKEREK